MDNMPYAQLCDITWGSVMRMRSVAVGTGSSRLRAKFIFNEVRHQLKLQKPR